MISLNFILSPILYAQELSVFGEINSSGSVLLKSPNNNWKQIPAVYPLLENTSIKTINGISKIITKNGSKIDISSNTELSIYSKDKSIVTEIKNGTISFSINPSDSLEVLTKDLKISIINQIGSSYSMVAGPAAPNYFNTQGMVIVTEKGTFVRNINGRINVVENGKQVRLLNTGETYYASIDGALPVNPDNPSNISRSTLLLQSIISGLFVTGATIISFDALRGDHHHVESPSSF